MAEDDPWAAFADAPEVDDRGAEAEDPWAVFADAPTTRKRGRRRKGKRERSAPAARQASPGDEIIVAARDGDTFKLQSGNALRLWGVDAPELKQQGWDRSGQPVPIGQQSFNALSGVVTDGAPAIGPSVGESYGRDVAPVTVDGRDVGERQVRTGNALAAPDFLKADPPRQFDYMQAERLARLNGLGVHDTFAQTPSDFRGDLVVPTRETVAQFWDTPTPWAGMRPEDEAKYSALLKTSSNPDEIVNFARSAGATIDPADVVKWIKERDAFRANGTELPAYANYVDAPKVMTEQGDGAAGAAARGLANGVLPNFLEETGAIVDTLGGTNDRENVFNSDRRLADIYANNAAQNEAITRYDEYGHPIVTTAAEIAGGVVLPLGNVRSAAGLAKWGAGFGAASGLGQEGTIPERLTSGVVGAGEGLALTVLGGKALEAAAPYVGRAVNRATGKSADGALSVATDDLARSAPRPANPSAELPAMAMDAAPGASISQEMPRPPDGVPLDRPQPISQPLSEAQMQARAADVRPGDVVPIPSNQVGSVEEAAAIESGRFAPAKPVNEASALDSRTVISANGREIPKKGPLDLLTWLRAQGGIKDQGGNLRAMGIDNAPRDLDFARGEQRLGKLIDNDAGMNLDDAAMKAWEAGYLPGGERPDINAFLDAIDRTHSGAERFYHPDDLPEVAKFEGMRGDRQQLEEQLADGPVVVDRSVPATEPQPFPPPQAYEDWPSGGPDFAGNIRLDKLESPQDIKRALDVSERRVGFDAATRGRVSHAETERLASELGMTPEALLSRRKGQALNAEEALAARQILAKSGNELVNAAKRIQGLEDPGDELLAEFRQKWMRHVAIQEQVSGMTAEAGRALQQFRMAASSRAVRGDVLAGLVRGGGGKENLRDAARVLVDAVEMEPGKFNVLAEKMTRPTWKNKVSELYINFLLSWPQTHAVNITSNTLTSLAQIPEYAAAAVVGKARQALSRTAADRVTGSELGQRTFGLIQGAKEGAVMFARALKTGEPADFVAKVEGQEYKAISGLKGEVIRVPTRLLTAEDELFKGIARRMELNGLAARQAHREGLKGETAGKRIAELISNPTDEMLHAAEDYGRYVTFQAKLGPAAQDISNFANRHLPMKFFLPFVRTPTNLLKFAAERSPAAPFLKEWRNDFRAGGARRDIAVARMLVGTGLGAVIYQAAADGRITGAVPADGKKARLLYADGWKPYSVKVGDTYYSYRRLDPFSTTIGVAADLATLPEGMSERQRRDAVTLAVASIMGNLANKTWLSGVSDVVGALSDPERGADNLVQRLVGSLLVPNLVAGTARTLDPVQRETETVGDALKSRIPGLRDDLLPRHDIWGNVIKNEGGVGPDFLTPMWTSKALNDPVNKALLQIDYAPGYPSRKVGKEELSPEDYSRYSERAGQLSHSALKELVASPDWKAMSDADKVDAARKTVTAARKEAKGQLFAGKPFANDDDDGGAPAAANDPWAAFKDAPGQPGKAAGSVKPENDDWSQFKDPPQRDVIGNLMQIPGVSMSSFTSGFRTKEYQTDMRRRGYHPAENSDHLDGNSLDIVVPAGKSMRWLMGQVKQVEPTARFYPEGDHLHATFPEWYGAPVLGGAKAAGLRNPMAGR